MSKVKWRLCWMTCLKRKEASGNCPPPSELCSWPPVVVLNQENAFCSLWLVKRFLGHSTAVTLVTLPRPAPLNPPLRVPGCPRQVFWTQSRLPTSHVLPSLKSLLWTWLNEISRCVCRSTNPLCVWWHYFLIIKLKVTFEAMISHSPV